MIQKIFSKTKLLVSSVLVLVAASIFFYIQFENFKPNEGVDLKEMNGNRIASKNNVPKPDDAEILGVSRSNDTTQTTYETTKSPKEIREFYENILKNEGWKLEMQEEIESSLKSKFIKENQVVTITSASQENSEKTIVSMVQINK